MSSLYVYILDKWNLSFEKPNAVIQLDAFLLLSLSYLCFPYLGSYASPGLGLSSVGHPFFPCSNNLTFFGGGELLLPKRRNMCRSKHSQRPPAHVDKRLKCNLEILFFLVERLGIRKENYNKKNSQTKAKA